jgi:hypothetical protein
MKRFSEQLQKKSMLIRLKAVEKDAMRESLMAFMEYHPVTAVSPKTIRTRVEGEVVSPFRIVHIPALYTRMAAGAFVLLFVIGIPALAERAVPGDILYPIKVQVTEEIRGSLNRDPYQKVAWETTRLERRITEARQLAKAGKLTPEVQASVLEGVQAQKATTESEIATLRTTDAEGASLAQLTYVTMLDVQSTVLKADDSASTTVGKSTVALASAIDASLVEVQEKDTSDTVSLERLHAQLEVETTRSYELLQSISGVATDQEQKDLARRLADVDRKISDATNDAAMDDAARKTALLSAWSDVQKLIAFMTDIDVRASVAIETLVPAVPTDSERLATIIQNSSVASGNLSRIENGLAAVKDEGLVKKVKASLPHVHELLDTASTSQATDVTTAEAAAKEAFELTTSMVAMMALPAPDTSTSSTSTVPVVLPTTGTSTASTTSATSSDATSTSVDSAE